MSEEIKVKVRHPRKSEMKEIRRKEGEERQAAYEALSVADRIAMLDRKLGVGVGAVKQRARLKAMLDAKPAPKEEVQEVVEPKRQSEVRKI